MPYQQARARDRRHRILAAAAELFSRRGYAATAMDEIARKAATSKGGLYFHFPGKQALLLALLDHTSSMLMDKVGAAMTRETAPVAKAEAALLVLLETLGQHRTLARVFAIEALGAGPAFHRHVHGIYDQFALLIREQLARAVRDGAIDPVDTEVAARAWVGMLDATVRRWVTTEEPQRLEAEFPALRLLLLRSVGVEVAARSAATVH